MPKASPKTPADVINDVGPVLFDDAAEWPSRLAAALGIKGTALRDLRRGKAGGFGPAHGLFDDLLALAEKESTERERVLALAKRRAREVAKARDGLRAWLKKNRTSA